MQTDVILAPGACVPEGLACQSWPVSVQTSGKLRKMTRISAKILIFFLGCCKSQNLGSHAAWDFFLRLLLMQRQVQNIHFCNASTVKWPNTNLHITLGVSSNAKICFPCCMGFVFASNAA